MSYFPLFLCILLLLFLSHLTHFIFRYLIPLSPNPILPIRFLPFSHSYPSFSCLFLFHLTHSIFRYLIPLSPEPVFSITFLPFLPPSLRCFSPPQLTEALSFLHYSCHVIHRNVTPASVFVTKRGTWKLGGLEFTGEYHGDCWFGKRGRRVAERWRHAELL